MSFHWNLYEERWWTAARASERGTRFFFLRISEVEVKDAAVTVGAVIPDDAVMVVPEIAPVEVREVTFAAPVVRDPVVSAPVTLPLVAISKVLPIKASKL